MDEAKSLVHMSVSAMFAAMLIAAAVSLIGVGYTMWAYFSRQDHANSRMSEYSKYTAFDNTTVRGQEVVQLIGSDLDVFVVVLEDKTPDPHSIDNMTSIGSTPLAVSYGENYSEFKPSSIDSTSNSIITCENALKAFNGITSKLSNYSSKNLKKKSYNELVKEFTSGSLEKPATNNMGTPIDSNSYAAFKSVLVYEGDTTTDVVGIVLVRENGKVNSY